MSLLGVLVSCWVRFQTPPGETWALLNTFCVGRHCIEQHFFVFTVSVVTAIAYCVLRIAYSVPIAGVNRRKRSGLGRVLYCVLRIRIAYCILYWDVDHLWVNFCIAYCVFVLCIVNCGWQVGAGIVLRIAYLYCVLGVWG